MRGQVSCPPCRSAQPLDHRARTSHCSRAQTHASARARARTLSARRSLSPAPHSCRSSLSSQRLCAGFHASPDSLMGAARSRHLILSAHTWARAAFAGTGLPLPACLCRSSAPGSGRPPPAHCNLSSTRCSPVARSVITRRRAYAARVARPDPCDPLALTFCLPSAQIRSQAPSKLVKPMLFVCKLPMVYGTIISGIIVFGAVIFVSAMLSGSGPSPSSWLLPPPSACRRPPASRTRRSASSHVSIRAARCPS